MTCVTSLATPLISFPSFIKLAANLASGLSPRAQGNRRWCCMPWNVCRSMRVDVVCAMYALWLCGNGQFCLFGFAVALMKK